MNDGRYPVDQLEDETREAPAESEDLRKSGKDSGEPKQAPLERPSGKFFENKRRIIFWIIAAVAAICLIAGAVALIRAVFFDEPDIEVTEDPGWENPDYVDVFLIGKNPYSRPGTKLDAVNGIVVHYVANPGTSAEANRSYFAGLASSGATYASSNFIIGLDGEVLQCVPVDEVAYASNDRNSDTLSIECCHPDETGVFTYPTYRSLVRLCADICIGFGLDPETDIIRHYDIKGKLCPLYFVEHEDEWYAFLDDVAKAVAETKSAETSEK